MSEQKYNSNLWHSGNEELRQQLIAGLEERGYNPRAIVANGATEKGYHEMQFTADGNRMISSRSNEAYTIFRRWKNPEDFEWIKDFLIPEDLGIEMKAYLRNGGIYIPENELYNAQQADNEETE